LNDIDNTELKNFKTRYYKSDGEMRFLKLDQPNLTWFVYSILFIFIFGSLWDEYLFLFRNISPKKFLLVSFILDFFNVTNKWLSLC
jgi:hypothetical protein